MFHKLLHSGSVSPSVKEGGQTGWHSNSSIPIWFSRICFHVELMCTKKGPQEWSPANVRGALIPGTRLRLTSHWGLSVHMGPLRWRPGPPQHYQSSTGQSLPSCPLTLNFTDTSVPTPGVILITGDEVPRPPHLKILGQQRAIGTTPLTNYCSLYDVRHEHPWSSEKLKSRKFS